MRASFSFPVGLLLFLLVVKQHECFSVYNVENCLSSSSNRYPLSNHIITKASLHRVGGVKTKRDGPIILLSTSSATSTAFDNEGMEDAIRKEFSVGCEGLDKDVARLFRPGIENVLSYQPVAQKAWIRRVRVARGQDVDFTPFNEQEVTPQGSPSSSYETPKSIATSEKVVTALERVKAYFSGNTDGLTIKEKLAKMGLSVALSYSFVSNLAGCSSVVLTWYIFCKKTGLSPLAAGQWKPFVAVYAGFYLFHNIVRPARFALSVALGPKFDRLLAWVQERLKVNKGVAILVVMLSLNVVCSCGGMCAGILLVSRMTGVPIFPGK